MTDQAFEEMLFAGVSSIHKRGALLTHNVLLLHRIKGLEEEIARLSAAANQTPAETEAVIRRDERQRIAAWIDQTNEGDTVRAKYARKVAETLRLLEA